VGIAVWLMGRKVYAASAAAGARYEWSFTESNGDQLREIAALVDSGAIKPVVDREFAFDQLPAALDLSRGGPGEGQGGVEGEVGELLARQRPAVRL
jgi:alcohol dehydrogenase